MVFQPKYLKKITSKMVGTTLNTRAVMTELMPLLPLQESFTFYY